MNGIIDLCSDDEELFPLAFRIENGVLVELEDSDDDENVELSFSIGSRVADPNLTVDDDKENQTTNVSRTHLPVEP
jgi:hypothetical protein